MRVIPWSRAPLIGLVLLTAALLSVVLGLSITSAAKPMPKVMAVSVTASHLGATCGFAAHVEWTDVHGPGIATIELVGSHNRTSARFRANAGGVDVVLWPASTAGPSFGEVDIRLTKKSGATTLLARVTIPPVSCPTG